MKIDPGDRLVINYDDGTQVMWEIIEVSHGIVVDKVIKNTDKSVNTINLGAKSSTCLSKYKFYIERGLPAEDYDVEDFDKFEWDDVEIDPTCKVTFIKNKFEEHKRRMLNG
jgi:hypothetical protein